MAKHEGRLPKIAKMTRAAGTMVIDVETGLVIDASNEDDSVRPSARGDASTERRSQPPSSPNAKLSRN